MYRIYLEKKSIVICHPQEQALSDPNAIRYSIGEKDDIRSIVQMFETPGSNLGRIFIPTDDVESTYIAICAEFRQVDAGGGLVSNRRGDFLLINRGGLWDLPKGHREEGEDIRVTALREVQEETGVKDLTLKDLICITDHCYRRDGIWHLKHTWWFDMLYTAPADLIPQTEEDITKAAWVAKSSLPDFLDNTYPSITEVVREKGVI